MEIWRGRGSAEGKGGGEGEERGRVWRRVGAEGGGGAKGESRYLCCTSDIGGVLGESVIVAPGGR